MSEHRGNLEDKASLLVADVKSIMANITSKEALVTAAEASTKTARELAEEMKSGAASLGSSLREDQVRGPDVISMFLRYLF